MREIKFRAWCEEREKFLQNQSEVRIEINSPNILKYNPLTGGYYATDKIVLMQYTGLKDKNGKEIYEGDIILTVATSDYPEDTGIKKVIWNDDWFQFQTIIHDNGYGLPLLWGGYKSLEVIGNIYENPELVKDGR